MRNFNGGETHITIKPNEGNLPMLVCSKCGKRYAYNNVSDFESDYPVCAECKRALKGGPLDGKTVGDLY